MHYQGRNESELLSNLACVKNTVEVVVIVNFCKGEVREILASDRILGQDIDLYCMFWSISFVCVLVF